MLEVTHDEILQITEHVLGTMLEMNTDGDFDQQLIGGGVEAFTGCVHISGEWQGAVVVQGTPELGRLLAARFLELPASDVTEADILDSAAELTNMARRKKIATLVFHRIEMFGILSGCTDRILQKI